MFRLISVLSLLALTAGAKANANVPHPPGPPTVVPHRPPVIIPPITLRPPIAIVPTIRPPIRPDYGYGHPHPSDHRYPNRYEPHVGYPGYTWTGFDYEHSRPLCPNGYRFVVLSFIAYCQPIEHQG